MFLNAGLPSTTFLACLVTGRATGSGPLVLLGHGGGQHKTAPGLVARARRYVTDCAFAVAAIDAPGFGDRPRTERDEQLIAEVSASVWGRGQAGLAS